MTNLLWGPGDLATKISLSWQPPSSHHEIPNLYFETSSWEISMGILSVSVVVCGCSVNKKSGSNLMPPWKGPFKCRLVSLSMVAVGGWQQKILFVAAI